MRASLYDAAVGDTRTLCQFMFHVRFVPLVACPLSTCDGTSSPMRKTFHIHSPSETLDHDSVVLPMGWVGLRRRA